MREENDQNLSCPNIEVNARISMDSVEIFDQFLQRPKNVSRSNWTQFWEYVNGLGSVT
jgi:hypothetical protein